MSEQPEISVELSGVIQEYPAPDGDGVIRVVEDINLKLDQPGGFPFEAIVGDAVSPLAAIHPVAILSQMGKCASTTTHHTIATGAHTSRCARAHTMAG